MKNSKAAAAELAEYQDDEDIVRNILHAVGEDSSISQRQLATILGIALGSVNWHLKRCINKGLIKISQAPLKRYLYYITPEGFEEKSKLTASYLQHSLSLFRLGRKQSQHIFEECQQKGYNNITLIGSGDLAEIFILSSYETDISINGIIDNQYKGCTFCGKNITTTAPKECDAFILTDMNNPVQAYKNIKALSLNKEILVPKLLEFNPKQLEAEI